MTPLAGSVRLTIISSATDDVPIGYVRESAIGSIAASLADANGLVNAETFIARLRDVTPALSTDAQMLAEAALKAVQRKGVDEWTFASGVRGRFNESDNGIVYLVAEVHVSSDTRIRTEDLMSFSKAMDEQFRAMGVWIGGVVDVMPLINFDK